MMEEKKLGLLAFLTAGELPYRIMVIESREYLKPLRAMYPYGEIYCVTADQDAVEEYAPLDIQWAFVDYLQEQIPLEQQSFDYIICEDCLELSGNPQDIATGLGLYLKDTGYFLMSFTNIRYWRVLENLMDGHFYHICSRVFAKSEMLSLMSASFYKDVNLLPEWGSEPPEKVMERLELAGFENIEGDLLAKKWLLQAAKSTPEILELKRMYTPEIRSRLAKLLRRLEYGVAVSESRQALWELCQSEMIFPAYLASFIGETVMHLNDLLWQLSPWQAGEEEWLWQELLEELYSLYEAEQAQLGANELADGLGLADELGSLADKSQIRKLAELKGWLDGEPLPEYAYAEAAENITVDKGTAIAFITCVNNEELYREAKLYLEALKLPHGMTAEYVPVYGAASMCQGYNQGAARTHAKYKVYIHQDALIVNKYFIYDLLRIFQDSSVGAVGVIGARRLPSSGIWWDAMRSYGRVLHACEPECIVETDCMEPPEPWMEVEAVDGLMMATQVDIPWREELFDGWHFYDISMCKELARQGYRVVVPHQKRCWCIHCPKEKPLDPAYRIYQKRFLAEYGQELDPEV